MQKPNLQHERALWRKGFRFVAGLDEVGVGPLAGPVVAACVILPHNFSVKVTSLAGLKDSKALQPKQRKYFARLIKEVPGLQWSIGKVYPRVIDRINVFQASRLAMHRALKRLARKPHFLLIDGAALLKKNSIAQRAIVKGDKKVFSIAAASVLAKVCRDQIMERYAKKFPGYEFARHKGYGTKAHYHALVRLGPSRIHRRSFLRS